MNDLYAFMAEFDLAKDKTIEAKDGRPQLHIVQPHIPSRCVSPPFAKMDDGSVVVVGNHPSRWPYEAMPRFWREQLFPDHFRRWTEAQHDARRDMDGRPIHTAWSWLEQQIVWQHLEVWEAMFDGEMTRDQATAYVANLEPFPRLPRSAVEAMRAKVVTRREHVTVVAPESQWTEGTVRGVSAERLAEAERLVADLRAEHPEATEAELAALLVRAA